MVSRKYYIPIRWSLRSVLRWLSTAGWVSVEGGFGEDDMRAPRCSLLRGMCEVWDAVVKRRNREDFGRFELVDHVHKFLHNVPLADRSFSGMGHVLRHAMCRAAHGEGAGEITSPCL